MTWDLIGDIHGEADALERLLGLMGYGETDGVYRHEQRRVVFLGDFVDRGPQQVRAVQIARRMVESGTALSVMGNHEYNAVCFATEDPAAPGQYLRPHISKNLKQHAAFLEQLLLECNGGFEVGAHLLRLLSHLRQLVLLLPEQGHLGLDKGFFRQWVLR